MTETKAAYENPLIPNARVRQIYRAILRAHLLGRALPPSRRALTAGREAALVSASIDLGLADLISDALVGPVLDFLRGTPLNRALRPNRKSAAGRILADCGSASRLLAPPDPAARLWSALGAAAALQAAAARAKKAAPGLESAQPASNDSSVVVACALPAEVSAAVWKAVLAFASQHDLPIVFVVLPAPAQKTRPRAALNVEKVDLRAIAHHSRVPALPVDADDAVALYRAAQESIGHARIGGGPALIQCIPFALESAPRRSAPPAAAITSLESYILHRHIATRRWMENEASSFAAQIARLRTASK